MNPVDPKHQLQYNLNSLFSGTSKSSLCRGKRITFIPSSIRTKVSDDEEDSIDITPLGPILLIVSAIRLPTNRSFPADIEATAEKRKEKNNKLSMSRSRKILSQSG